MTTTATIAHSYSRLVAYSACPLSYKLQFLDKMPQEDSAAGLEIGSASHDFFDKFIKAGKFVHQTEEKAFEAHVMSLAARCFQNEPRSQENFPAMLEICETFAKQYKPDPNYPIVSTEMALAFKPDWSLTEWNNPQAFFRAKIDMLEKTDGEVKKVRVTDFKTSFSGKADPFQNAIYAFICSLIYPKLEQIEVVYWYTRSGFKSVKLYNCEDMGVVKVQIEALTAKIETDSKFKARPGARCQDCPVAGHCSEVPSSIVKISSNDVAMKLGDEISFLDAQVKAKKKALSSWCAANGPVESGGLVWNHYPAESINVDIAPLLSTCVSMNIDPGKLLNLDSRAFKKVCKDNPMFAETMTPYVSYDVSTRFYGKKAVEED